MKYFTVVFFFAFTLVSYSTYSQEAIRVQGEKNTQNNQTSTFSDSDPTGVEDDSIDKLDGCKMFFPNTFTPNGDNLNDVFRVYTECVPQKFNVRIYTRWGEMLFESNNPNFEWDGKRNGKVPQSAVFVYIVNYSAQKQKNNVSGTITLLN